ncbi:hypothetical protein [Planococcus lenghuensis]|nr:hypothetical protein [Planococcus lenghuensis]
MNHLDELVLRLKREEMHTDIHRYRWQQRTGKPSARVKLWLLLLTVFNLR